VTDEERQRIAREYGVEVPDDIQVQTIPQGTSGMPAAYSRREAYNRARIVIQRGWKFQAAERKRRKNHGKRSDAGRGQQGVDLG
jgi:hypothetical protein